MSEFKRIHVDPEKLIRVVKSRPMIYDKDDPNYYNSKKNKAECWMEICTETVPNWNKLTPQARVECCYEIQKRWKSLRTCFAREVSEQKKEKLRRQKNLPLKRRKIYGYFKDMSFLLPHFNIGARPKPDEGDFVDQQESEDSDDPLEGSIKAEVDLDRETKNDEVLLEDEFNMYENTDDKIEFGRHNKDEDCDDVKQFLMSLVPTFKKLDDRQKLEAKIEILKVLKNISFSSGPSS